MPSRTDRQAPGLLETVKVGEGSFDVNGPSEVAPELEVSSKAQPGG